MSKKIGKKIARLRKAKGWRQAALAVEAGVSKPFMCQIESGKRGMGPSTVEAVAKALGIPPSDLI